MKKRKEIPNTKSQIPNKNQISNSNGQNKTRNSGPKRLEFGYSVFGNYLGFDAWNLVL